MRFTQLMLLASAVVIVSGCVTESYVDERVAGLEDRLESRLDDQDERFGELSETSRQALERATEAGALAEGKFLYSIVFTDDSIKFESDNATLSPDAQQRLTELAGRLKEDNDNVYLEIQGHTDSTGPEAYNQRLGLERAEAVRRFLHTQDVALNRMATISYGEAMPAADNSTPEGRAANRRVEIVVLE